MSFEQLFANAARLPTIPKVLQEIILSFGNPDIDMDIIAKQIAHEPVLTAKLLKVANSARYGSPRKIASLNEAIVLLGFPTVRTIVLACGLVDTLSFPAKMDRRAFWSKAFSVAGCCKWLTQAFTSDDENTAYTSGMIHSMGELLMFVVFPEKAEETLRLTDSGLALVKAQQEVFGYNHCEVGAEMAKRWKFPEPICTALAQQHKPEAYQPTSRLAATLNLATTIAEQLNDDKGIKDIAAGLAGSLLACLNIDAESLASRLSQVEQFDGGMSALLS